jgi:hypothetical protein
MPIRREYRWLYPIDWPQLSASIRFGRAKGRCERCRRPHGRLVFHLGMVGGGMMKQPHRGTVGTGRSHRGRSRSPRKMAGSLRPKSCWRPPTSTTIPATTRRAISKPAVNAAICCMTGKSIAGDSGSLFEKRMLWAIYFSGSIPIKRRALTRDEHLAWCRRQALEHVNAGDLAQSISTMETNLKIRPDTDNPALRGLVMIGMMYVTDGDKASVQRWIERFR